MSVQPASVITQASADSNVLLAYLLNNYDPNGTIKLDFRGTILEIKRSELLKFPESILLGISNGLYFDDSVYLTGNDNELEGKATANEDPSQMVASVNFPPRCFQYTLEAFRQASEDLHKISAHHGDLTPTRDQFLPDEDVNDLGDMLRIYPAIIVLKEDLDYYCLPTKQDMSPDELNGIKRACGRMLSAQNSIFNGLRKSESPNSPERHLIDMLCSSGFNTDTTWGFREQEPDKTVITSLALVRLKVGDLAADSANGNEAHRDGQQVTDMSTSHKLLLFWKKPARKCWWDSVNLEGVEGVEGQLRVHIRRVWTLELSVIDST